MKRLFLAFLFSLALFSANPSSAAEQQTDFKNSVVKIFTSASVPDFEAPWQEKESRRFTGSGAVISGNRILTNAHVVAYATYIEVKKSDSDRRYRAEVEAVGNDCDLALLKVNDETFFDGSSELPIGPLPALQDSVLVVGFPKGGEELSVTKGIVSRIDAVSYSNSGEEFMAVQIDAAVNHGNSGGPVIQNNLLVGIAFQGLEKASSIGYMIPEPIIKHFLDDLKDGHYDGFPYVGIAWNQSANPSIREHYGLKDFDGGLILKYVSPEIEKQDLLRVGDVVLSIDGTPVGSDGTVSFNKSSRMPVGYLFDLKQVGETIEFEVLRDGRQFKVKAPTLRNDVLVKYRSFYENPPYYIYGGLVFTVLNQDLMEALKNYDVSHLQYYIDGPGRFEEDKRKDVIVLLNVLPDEVNAGYHDVQLEVVKDANGKRANTLEELAIAIESNQTEWDVIRTEDKNEIVLYRKKAQEAGPRILKNYRIPFAYSDDIATALK